MIDLRIICEPSANAPACVFAARSSSFRRPRSQERLRAGHNRCIITGLPALVAYKSFVSSLEPQVRTVFSPSALSRRTSIMHTVPSLYGNDEQGGTLNRREEPTYFRRARVSPDGEPGICPWIVVWCRIRRARHDAVVLSYVYLRRRPPAPACITSAVSHSIPLALPDSPPSVPVLNLHRYRALGAMQTPPSGKAYPANLAKVHPNFG
ncbi:hypothetical protein C8R47DRAFT_1193065 [Mycena vitilis]|nr:hypothetical protein C8R47DRAFT_1193065 [Mycena vitilis]